MDSGAQAAPETARELVPRELEILVTTGALGQADSLVRLLRYIVEEALAGRSQSLKEYTLGVEVFRRGADFDPRLDTIVRTQVRRLRAKLDRYYAERGRSAQIRIAIPKGTYVPLFLEPPGRDAAKDVTPRKAGVFGRTAPAVALAMIALLAMRPQREFITGERSVAVLPFADLSADAAHHSVADALSEQISQALAATSAAAGPQIRIASRTSTLEYRDRGTDVRRLGARLGVRAIVEGSIRAVGDRVRVTTDLVSTEDGYRLWSRSWEGSAAELDRIPEEAATGISTALGVTTGNGGTRHPAARDPEAYSLYLKGRIGNNDRALAYLEAALQRDPRFGPAWLGKAELLSEQARHAVRPPAETLPEARLAALAAIRNGEDSSGAHVVLAQVASWYDWNWDEAEAQYRKALQLEPDSEYTRIQYALLLIARHRTAQALEEIQRIRAVASPAGNFANAEAAALYFTRQYDRVIRHCAAVLDMAPGDTGCQFWIGRAYLAKDMAKKAAACLEKSWAPGGMGFASPITAYIAAGRRSDALRLRADAEKLKARAWVSPVSLAQMHFAFGEMEEGFRELDRALDARDHSLATLAVDPIYDSIRSDPRFQSVLKTIHL